MVYIDGMSQITPQGDGWYESPVHYGPGLHPASDPPYAGIVPSSAARRMSLLQKRAVATAFKAMDMAGLGMPDAIITATGAGTMKNSENFLLDMVTNGEEGLSPTPLGIPDETKDHIPFLACREIRFHAIACVARIQTAEINHVVYVLNHLDSLIAEASAAESYYIDAAIGNRNTAGQYIRRYILVDS